MARYKPIDTNSKILPVDLARQLRPGTFECALNYLLDHEIALSTFDQPSLPPDSKRFTKRSAAIGKLKTGFTSAPT